MWFTSTIHPKGKRKDNLVIGWTYRAHRPRNPHRRSLGLGAAHGHVRRSPALHTTPSHSARTRHHQHHDCPRIQQTHTWNRDSVIQMWRMTPYIGSKTSRVIQMVWASQHWLGLLATRSNPKTAILSMPTDTRIKLLKENDKHNFYYFSFFYLINASPKRLR